MMLWYTALTGILLIIFIPVLYQSISASLYSNQESILRLSMSQITSALEINNAAVSYSEEDAQLPPNIYSIIVNSRNQVIYRNSSRLDWLGDTPFENEKIRTIKKGNESWITFDAVVVNEGKKIAFIRVCSSLEAVEDSLNRIKLLMLIAVPAFLALAIFGGLFIARRALEPISKITKTAQTIGNGDLSKRINDINTRDEVGRLASTFNSMLDKLEVSFNREKQFASDASHELRTPVAIMMAYSESLIGGIQADTFRADELENSLRSIYKESRRMSRIISQLLMLTRGYEGKYRLEIEIVDLNEIIENVTEHLEETARKANISLTRSIEKNISLMADQSLVTQMLINLIENGIKYGKNGGSVQVDARLKSGQVQITVKDDGIGIPENELPFIFDRFYRADKSRDRSGTGLGLSIVKWIVEEHHGDISVTSQPGQGTSFQVLLPCGSGSHFCFP